MVLIWSRYHPNFRGGKAFVVYRVGRWAVCVFIEVRADFGVPGTRQHPTVGRIGLPDALGGGNVSKLAPQKALKLIAS